MPLSKPAPDGPLVELCGVSKSYGGVRALRCVSLRVRAGEILALLGPNGAGKTTLLSILLGLCSPTHGLVRICGMPPHDPALRPHVRGLLQGMTAPSLLRVSELVRLFQKSVPGSDSCERILDAAALQARRDSLFGRLSSGEKQRLLIALAMLGEPRVAIFDEPTSCLDPCGRERFHEAARSLAARGAAVLFTTHDVAEARSTAHRVAVLAEGALSCSSN